MKKSNVIFVNNGETGMPEKHFTKNMLSWPIVNSKGEAIDPRTEKVYKDAFMAMLIVAGFTIKIAMNIKGRKIYLPTDNFWWKIYLGETEIIRQWLNRQAQEFKSIMEWPRIMEPIMDEKREKNKKQKEEEKIYKWSSVDNWVEFFKTEIIKNAQARFKSAQEQALKASRETSLGADIIKSLNK